MGRKAKTFERVWDDKTGFYTWRPVEFETDKVEKPEQPVPSPPGDKNEPQKQAEAELKAHEFIIEGTASVAFPNPHLRAGLLVTLVNLGSNFSGDYKVEVAKHVINRTDGYTQTLDLSRNATGLRIMGEGSPVQQSTRPGKPQVDPENKEELRYYTVKKGDTLWDIAQKYYGNGLLYTRIAEANNLDSPSAIYPGQRLIIP